MANTEVAGYIPTQEIMFFNNNFTGNTYKFEKTLANPKAITYSFYFNGGQSSLVKYFMMTETIGNPPNTQNFDELVVTRLSITMANSTVDSNVNSNGGCNYIQFLLVTLIL